MASADSPCPGHNTVRAKTASTPAELRDGKPGAGERQHRPAEHPAGDQSMPERRLRIQHRKTLAVKSVVEPALAATVRPRQGLEPGSACAFVGACLEFLHCIRPRVAGRVFARRLKREPGAVPVSSPDQRRDCPRNGKRVRVSPLPLWLHRANQVARVTGRPTPDPWVHA